MDRYRVTSSDMIELGRVGEHKAREIVFDISRWRSLYGEGIAKLMVRRSGEDVMYPVALEQRGDEAVWIVTETDAAIAGSGECELSYVCEDGTIAKSVIHGTHTKPSMRWETADPPVEAKPWIDEIRALATEMRDAIKHFWYGSVSDDDARYCIEFGTLEYNSYTTQELSFNFSQSYENIPVFIPHSSSGELELRVEPLRSEKGYYGGKITVKNLSGDTICATISVSAYCSLPTGAA